MTTQPKNISQDNAFNRSNEMEKDHYRITGHFLELWQNNRLGKKINYFWFRSFSTCIPIAITLGAAQQQNYSVHLKH